MLRDIEFTNLPFLGWINIFHQFKIVDRCNHDSNSDYLLPESLMPFSVLVKQFRSLIPATVRIYVEKCEIRGNLPEGIWVGERIDRVIEGLF